MHTSRNGASDNSLANSNVALGRAGSAPSIADMACVLLRHKWKAILFVGVTICLTVAAVVFYPRKYLSEAKLLVRVGRETATLDPTATIGHVVTVQKSRERDINSVREILRSQLIVEQVVDAIGVDAILVESKTPSFGRRILDRLNVGELDPITDREKAILLVRKQIRCSAAEGADVLTVSAKTSSPRSAQVLLQQFLDTFFRVHGSLSRVEGGHAFFQGQTELLRCQLSEALAALRDAKNHYGLLTVEGQRSILNTQLGSIRDQIGRIEAELAFSDAKAIELKKSVDSLPATVVTESVSGVGHDATDRMRAQLYELEIREKSLAVRYKDDHPLLMAIREQRTRVDDIFRQQPLQRTQRTTSVDTTRQQLKLDWLTETATITALRSKRQSLLAQQHELHNELDELNDHELQIVELDGEVERLTATYKMYADRLEQTRIDQAVEAEQISSINIVQPPTLSDRPVTPRKLPLLAIGLLLAASGSVCLVIAADYFDSSFTTPDQVERQLELPVLVSIPRMSRQRLVEVN